MVGKNQNIRAFTTSFAPISLESLNSKAAMLERNENKYVLTLDELYTMLPSLQGEFEILAIDGKSEFIYETIYFDTTDNICYRQHMQGKRQRFKARTRRYVDANIYFFEVKLKDIRGKTNKKRYACPSAEHGIVTNTSIKLLQKSFNKIYHSNFNHALIPSTKMTYSRVTLVAKIGGERMTIDYNLSFYDMRSKRIAHSPADFIIIETKSITGNGIADKIFKKHRHRSTSCSKFCLSKILLKHVLTYNKFLQLLKKSFPDFIRDTKRNSL